MTVIVHSLQAHPLLILNESLVEFSYDHPHALLVSREWLSQRCRNKEKEYTIQRLGQITQSGDR